MKIAEGLKLIQQGWVRKPKGFRVKFHRQTDKGWEASLSPPAEDAPLNSDVTAWRYAWKLGQATRNAAETDHPQTFYNITVVDDQGQPFRYYATGNFETFNPKSVDGEN